MTWRINFAYGDPTDPLDADAIGNAGRGLHGEDQRVAQELVFRAATDSSMQTVADLLSRLEELGQEGRRTLLDELRSEAGLPATATVDARREMAARSRALVSVVGRDEAGRAFLLCAAPDCSATPLNPVTGVPEATNARKWWCESHRDQATEGDMQPWSPRIGFARGGGLEWADEVEADQRRAEAEAESLRAKREHQAAERAQEADELRAHDAAMAEHFRPANTNWEPMP